MASDEPSDIFDKLDRQNSYDHLSSGKKSSWKDRLKGKIFTAKQPSGEPTSGHDPVASLRVNVTSQDDDIQQFLHPSGRNSSPPLLKKVLAPKLSVATSPGQDGANEIFLYHKPRRREGLNVGFTDTSPEIIGRGGDETIEPVVTISRLLKQAQLDGRTAMPLAAAHHFLPEPEEDPISMRPFKRIPTGFPPPPPPPTEDPRKLSAESESYQGSSTDSLRRHSPTSSSENVLFPGGSSVSSHQPISKNPEATSSDPVLNTDMGIAPFIRSGPYRREHDERGPRHHPPQPFPNDGAHLALPNTRARQGSSPSPARYPLPSAGDSNENERSTSQSSHDGNAGLHQTLSPLSLADPTSSSLSLSSRLSDKDPASNQSQMRVSQKESSPYFPKPEAMQTSHVDESASAREYLPYKPPSPSNGNGAKATSNEGLVADVTTSKDAAYHEFVRRISHTRQIFELISQRDTSSRQPSPIATLRAAIYWFITGRTGLEEYVHEFRTSTNNGINQSEDSPYAVQQILQNHVNLAKAWWLSTQIDAESERIGNPNQDQQPIDSGDKQGLTFLTSHFQNLTRSMAKRNLLPPEDLLVKGAETSLWLRYPAFPPQIGWILQNSASGQAPDGPNSPLHPLVALPLGHTASTSCLYTCPIECRVFSAAEEEGAVPYDTNPSEQAFPCLAFVLHRKADQEISFRISSLSHQVNVLVRERNQSGPSWEHVRWDEYASALRVKLPNRFRIGVKFRQQDFERIAAQYKTSQPDSGLLSPQDGSRLPVASNQTSSIQPTQDSAALHRPSDVSIPPPGVPQASHESLPGPLQPPAPPFQPSGQQLKPEPQPGAQVKVDKVEYLSAETQARSRVQLFRMENTLAEMLSPEDVASSQIDDDGASAYVKLQAYGFSFLEQVYNKDISCSFYVGPDTQSNTFSIQLLRPFFLKFCIEKEPSTKPDPMFLKLLQDFQDKVKHSSVISRWVFLSLEDLHHFQSLVFGTHVRFDGVAKAFSMSRRLPMVPVSKTYESNEVRVQIVQYRSAIQLLCFFSKYSLAQVLQFPLKSSDIIELCGQKGKEPGVKLIDAKFDLPSDDVRKRVEGGFINMEAQLPIDHEDVTIDFHSETERDRFVAALPAQATASKKFTLRRRI